MGRSEGCAHQAASGSFSKHGLWLAAALRTHPHGQGTITQVLIAASSLPRCGSVRIHCCTTSPAPRPPRFADLPALGVWCVFQRRQARVPRAAGRPLVPGKVAWKVSAGPRAILVWTPRLPRLQALSVLPQFPETVVCGSASSLADDARACLRTCWSAEMQLSWQPACR